MATKDLGLDWGKSLRHTSTMSRGYLYITMYIKLPHATETEDRLLPYGPHGSTRLPYLLAPIPVSSSTSVFNCMKFAKNIKENTMRTQAGSSLKVP